MMIWRSASVNAPIEHLNGVMPQLMQLERYLLVAYALARCCLFTGGAISWHVRKDGGTDVSSFGIY